MEDLLLLYCTKGALPNLSHLILKSQVLPSLHVKVKAFLTPFLYILHQEDVSQLQGKSDRYEPQNQIHPTY